MKSKRTATAFILCGYILILLGTIMLVRPLIARICQKIAALEFLYDIALLNGVPADMSEEVRSYNEMIRAEQAAHGFVYEDTYNDPIYDDLLKGPSGMLCVVEIPAIGVLLPVGHGTDTALLRDSAGHMHGSSLPVGGPSTHAVIAAHAGMPDRELFTKLPEVREGDKFFIYVLGEKHTYIVRKIAKVLPSEADALRITEGEDRVTLMTCIPYGINTHRLLVQGTRCRSGDTQAAEDLKSARSKTYAACNLWLTAIIILPSVFLILLFVRIVSRFR